MKHLFILNPLAGKQNRVSEFKEMIEKYFSQNGEEFEIETVEYPAHATHIAKKAGESGEQYRIYAFGGDGTLSETAMGAAFYDNLEVACYPCGTGNDFIKSFPDYLNSFNDLDALVKGKSMPIDLIKCNDRIGLNIGNVGFDAEVARHVNIFKKRFSGNFAYTLSVFYCFLSKTKSNLSIKIDDEEEVKGDFILTVAANGRIYGGGFKAAPKAIVDDGLLDLILIKSVSKLKILELLGKFKAGEHLELPIVTYKRGKKIIISSNGNITSAIDGEVFSCNSVVFEILPSALNFILPNKIN